MSFSKKTLVGITAVVAIAYSLRRWRSSSTDVGDGEFTTEQQSPTAD